MLVKLAVLVVSPLLLSGCVTTMVGPPRVMAVPVAQQVTPTPSKAPQTVRVQPASPAGKITPAYLLTGKPASTPATVAELKAEMDRLSPQRARAADKAIFARYRDGGSRWAANWTRRLDFSGVAWDGTRTATLISDRHVVMAAHYDRPRGAQVIFQGRDGRAVKRRLVGVKQGKPSEYGSGRVPDICVGLLDRPVPGTVTHYPLPAAGNYSKSLYNVEVLLTDGKCRVHRFRVRRIAHSTTIDTIRSGIGFKSDLDASWQENLVAGDSGNPAFLLVRGKLVLVGTHTSGGNGASGPFYGGAKIQAFLRSAIAELD